MKQAEAKLQQRDVAIFKWVAASMLVAFAAATVFITRPAPVRTGVQPARLLGDFHLTDRTGRTVSRSELRDKYLVVNFVFTSCAVSCLQVNQRMAEVQRLAATRDDVRLVSLTVDPGTDTPAVLAQFGEKFGADTNRWLLLTGDKQRLYELIEDSFLKRDPTAPDGGMPGGFVGTERIVLVDRTGRIRQYFDGFSLATPGAVMASLDKLSNENRQP